VSDTGDFLPHKCCGRPKAAAARQPTRRERYFLPLFFFEVFFFAAGFFVAFFFAAIGTPSSRRPFDVDGQL
jgi:hypothetical protein